MRNAQPYYWHQKRLRLQMSYASELVLDILSSKKETSIMDLVNTAVLGKVGSVPTVHNGFLWLKAHGYIKQIKKGTDTRKKFFILTTKGETYLQGDIQ